MHSIQNYPKGTDFAERPAAKLIKISMLALASLILLSGCASSNPRNQLAPNQDALDVTPSKEPLLTAPSQESSRSSQPEPVFSPEQKNQLEQLFNNFPPRGGSVKVLKYWQSGASLLSEISQEIGPDSRELERSATNWQKAAKIYRDNSEDSKGSHLRSDMLNLPCAFSNAYSAVTELDGSIRNDDLDMVRERNLNEYLETSNKSERQSVIEKLGNGWAPLVDSTLCRINFKPGLPRLLTQDWVAKKGATWTWQGNPEGLRYMVIAQQMEGFFGSRYFSYIELVPQSLMTALVKSDDSFSDPWFTLLRGPWWGSCSASTTLSSDLGSYSSPTSPQGCLVM